MLFRRKVDSVEGVRVVSGVGADLVLLRRKEGLTVLRVVSEEELILHVIQEDGGVDSVEGVRVVSEEGADLVMVESRLNQSYVPHGSTVR